MVEHICVYRDTTLPSSVVLWKPFQKRFECIIHANTHGDEVLNTRTVSELTSVKYASLPSLKIVPARYGFRRVESAIAYEPW